MYSGKIAVPPGGGGIRMNTRYYEFCSKLYVHTVYLVFPESFFSTERQCVSVSSNQSQREIENSLHPIVVVESMNKVFTH
jgi:hypothetical protein